MLIGSCEVSRNVVTCVEHFAQLYLENALLAQYWFVFS